MNISDMIVDPDFAQNYIVNRKSGYWDAGIFIETETQLTFYGVVTPAGTKDIIQVPEGDRTSNLMIFYSTQEILVTHNNVDSVGTSDEIEWRGDRYRIFKVLQWADFGYYKAFGVSMGGD